MGSMPALASVTNLYTGPLVSAGPAIFFSSPGRSTTSTARRHQRLHRPVAFTVFCHAQRHVQRPDADHRAVSRQLRRHVCADQPSGAVQSVKTTNNTASFTINEGGQFTLLLQRNGWTPSSPVTQGYNFVFTDSRLCPPRPASTRRRSSASTGWHEPQDPTVYYTLDGSAPTTNSTRYTGAFTLTNSAMVTASESAPDTPAPASATTTSTSSPSRPGAVGNV